MGASVSRKIIETHLLNGHRKGRPAAGEQLELRIDQTLTQDATGTLVMQQFEALGLDRVRTQLSAQYVDHNLLQLDYKNADDHLFLHSACRKWGIWYSRPGNGVSHPVHMERFGVPGATLLGSDSHTPAAGSLGMLAIGAGGLEVALAMAGQPFHLLMPRIRGVHVHGELPPWVSAKDVILEMLRRHGVKGGVGWIIEYYGPGLAQLSAMDRHVIANMGAELGATTSVFPADEEVQRFLASQGRAADFKELVADDDSDYDTIEDLDLSRLEPLIAKPSSPGNVVPVREVAGEPIYQSYIGSSANPGLRDFAVPAMMLRGRQVHQAVSLDINPSSRQILNHLSQLGYLHDLIAAGARIHQAGCNGCIGMGQAPATGRNSLRTVPRNFPGRSGTIEDRVFLCSPETAAASALRGVITDPRDLDQDPPRFSEPRDLEVLTDYLQAPSEDGSSIPLQRGPNITALPEFAPLSRAPLSGPVLIKVGDNVSTDEILPAGAEVLPYRSNIPKIAEFTFYQVDSEFSQRAMQNQRLPAFIVGGENYGQGSSREHAALAPRYLGVQMVLAKSYARIHWQNLANFGIIAAEFEDPADHGRIEAGDVLRLADPAAALAAGTFDIENTSRQQRYRLRHRLSQRQRDMITAGSLLGLVKQTAIDARS